MKSELLKGGYALCAEQAPLYLIAIWAKNRTEIWPFGKDFRKFVPAKAAVGWNISTSRSPFLKERKSRCSHPITT